MLAALRQLLPKNRQRRQIEIHRYAVYEHQGKIRSLARWREEQAVESLVVGGFESAQLRVDAHYLATLVFSDYFTSSRRTARLRQKPKRPTLRLQAQVRQHVVYTSSPKVLG